MLNDQEERVNSSQPEGPTHHEIMQLADDALSEAEQAIKVAREKLRVAQRNYAERMKLPTLRAQNGQPRTHQLV